MLFPFVGGNRAAGEETFNIFTIENLISSLTVPQNLPAKLLKPNILPPPSREAEKTRRKNVSRFILLVILQFFVVFILTILFGAGVGFFVGAILMMGLIAILKDASKSDKSDLEYGLEKAQKDWNQLEDEWTITDATSQFDKNLSLIKRKISEHQSLQQQSREKIKLLHDEVFQYKLDLYLSSFKITDAKILGSGRKNLGLLKNFGIRSAADVDAKRLDSLPPMNGEIKAKAIEWRKNLERNFEYHPGGELPEADRQRLTHDFTEKRGKIEREIEKLLGILRAGSTLLCQRQQHLSAKAESAARQLLQSRSDLTAIGGIASPIVLLILITILIPMFGNVFSNLKSSRTSLSSNRNNPRIAVSNSATNRGFGYSTGSGSKTNTVTVSTNYYTVPDALSDQEIEAMSDIQKESGARQLLERAEKFADEEKNYKKAGQILQLALKLDAHNTKILNKLGDVLYEQKIYKESLVYLNRSFLLDSKNTDTEFLIGINHLKMLHYENARQIFSDLTEENPESFESHFNLGQAYKGLSQYYAAVSSFRKAIEIKPDSADTRYHYAMCLHKLDAAEDVQKEYQKLLESDPQVAEKLRKNLGLKKLPRNTGSGDGIGSGNGTGMRN